jgi:hypothetical protein
LWRLADEPSGRLRFVIELVIAERIGVRIDGAEEIERLPAVRLQCQDAGARVVAASHDDRLAVPPASNESG